MDRIITFLGLSMSVKDMFTQPKSKKILLDPMTTIFRLCVLGLLEDGIKLRIVDNQIHYQEKSVIRGLTRWYYGDSKEILSNLHKPICLYLKKYKDIGFFHNLNDYAIEGLVKLKETYVDYELIEHSLQHYIKLIEAGSIEDELTEQEEKYYEIYDIWTESEIELTYHLLREYINRKENATLNAINKILEGKDEKLRKIIIS